MSKGAHKLGKGEVVENGSWGSGRPEIRALQDQVAGWAADKPFKQKGNPAMAGCKLAEEVGEALGCLVRMEQGVQAPPDYWLGRLAQELGDVQIILSRLADVVGLDLSVCAWNRWSEVSQRDVMAPRTPEERQAAALAGWTVADE